MKKKFGKMIALSTFALMMCLISCKVSADLDASDNVQGITWIDLLGSAPDASGTAELSLDFSGPIADLKPDIFSFVYYKEKDTTSTPVTISVVKVTPDEGGAGNMYRLEVKNAPTDGGKIEVTIKKSNVKPSIRSWYLDGSRDYAPPAILEFKLMSDASIVGLGSISQENITVIVPHGTDKTALKPIITLNPKNLVDPGNQIVKDFTNPVSYMVTSGNGVKKIYTVTVTE
jgi:hypothetical protein